MMTLSLMLKTSPLNSNFSYCSFRLLSSDRHHPRFQFYVFPDPKLPPIFSQPPPHCSGLEATSVFFIAATHAEFWLELLLVYQTKCFVLFPLEPK